MGLMTSTLFIFGAMTILSAFVVPKLIHLFTAEGWSAQPYSINCAQPHSIKSGFKQVINPFYEQKAQQKHFWRKQESNPEPFSHEPTL